MTFRAPVRDLAFSLIHVADVVSLRETHPDFDDETLAAVLEGAAALAETVLAPLNRSGDQVGCQLLDGRVVTPPGFREAYRLFAEGGWTGLAASSEYGGQALPRAVAAAVTEIVHGANMSFGLGPTLSEGAIEALSAHGTARQKALFLPKLVAGEWTGTMNLTESQAGSDLSLLRTQAEPDGSRGYRINGEKIFITWGDHDCSDNIVHLVLARTPDAPRGVQGLSLFLTPKRLVGEDGGLGPMNAIRCGGLEHKLGIHASPTCTMLFEGAQAELLGEVNQGLACMFTMMNSARLNIGVQGVGIAERAYQQALAYAQERRQGRSPWIDQVPAPIFDHPEIRRSLALMKAKIEAGRGICLSTAVSADIARRGASAAARERARLREDLFTPIAKAWCTDMAVEVASAALQLHGGMGYIEETGAAQSYRDARIAPIYEGTNAIQAVDLIGRKLGAGDGESVRHLVGEIGSTIEQLGGGDLDRVAGHLKLAVQAVEAASAWLLPRRGTADSLAGASAYLKLMGDVIGGWMLAKAALAAPGTHRVKLARIYADQVLASASTQAMIVCCGADDLETLSARDLTD